MKRQRPNDLPQPQLKPEDSPFEPLTDKMDSVSGLPLRIRWRADDAEMVLVSAGQFVMGSGDELKIMNKQFPATLLGIERETPQRQVHLDAYYIDVFPTTNDRFSRFIRTSQYQAQGNWEEHANLINGTHPVVAVSWRDASEYAKWACKKLPTEAQWEKATRGTDARLWPWGNDWNADWCNTMIYQETHNAERFWKAIEDTSKPVRGFTTAVGSFPNGASPYGCHDMAGNVFEFCADWYSASYYKHAPDSNPQGPETGDTSPSNPLFALLNPAAAKQSFQATRVIRGGDWTCGKVGGSMMDIRMCRCAARTGGKVDGGKSGGFRTVIEVCRL